MLAERVKGAGHVLADKGLVPDDRAAIRAKVNAWIASKEVDVIVTTLLRPSELRLARSAPSNSAG